jgi:feruloyl-CoA synthase
MHKRHRPVPFGPADITVERDHRGHLLVRSADPLGPYPARLTERLAHWADAVPDRTFLAKRDDTGAFRKLSYAAAFARVQPLAAALLARGLDADRPLMILSENDLDHALLALAALHVGVPFVPISPAYSLVSRDFERLREVVRMMTPGLVFASDGTRFGRAVAAVVPETTEVVLREGTLPGARKHTPLSALYEQPESPSVARAHRTIGAQTIAKFLLTSGSTGTPKATVQTMGMLTSNLQMMVQQLPFLAEEPPLLVDWLPWHHTFGGNHNFGLTVYNGGTMYIDDGKPTPDAFRETLRNLREIAPTVYFNVPRGFDELARALAQDDALARVFFSRVRLLFYAAAGLSQATWHLLEEVAERSCGERIAMITGLGMTETSPLALTAHWPDGRPGAIGIPAPGLALRLAKVGCKTEARYRGPSVTPGFWRDDARTAEAFDEDGFYRSGDAVVFMDPERPAQGLMFDGRIAEDFKLDTGTWVSVGPLRARVLAEGAPYVQDVVPTAPNRSELGILIIPHPAACRELCPELPASSALDQVLSHPSVRAFFQELLARLAVHATGSANRITRALVLTTPLSLDGGEITDKGSVVQATVRHTRAATVDRLYSNDEEVLRL